jgi:hyperosmotically inducible protein
MRQRTASVAWVSVVAWSALLVVPLSAKTKPAAERAEKPSLEVEEKAQEAADRADRASDKAVRMLDRVIIKIRPKPGETKTPSDTWLTAKTKLALVADERITGRQMTVETQNGIITLGGTVDSDEAKTAAEEAAKSVEGWKDVKNNLRVTTPSQERSDEKDSAISQRVNAALKREAKLKKAEIAVQTEDGVVTLTGASPDLLTSAHAAWTAWNAKGVRVVRNELTMKSK